MSALTTLIQAIQGDYLSDPATRHHVDSISLIPDDIIIASLSQLDKIADLVSTTYRALGGTID